MRFSRIGLIICFCLITLFLVILSGCDNYDGSPLEPPATAKPNQSFAPIAYYPFDNNANDASGNGFNGIENGGVGYSTGVLGSALQLDGVDDYVDLGNAFDLPSFPSYSVSVWFKNDGGGSYVDVGQKIIDQTILYHDFYMAIMPDGRLRYYTYEGGGTDLAVPSGNYQDNQWHHSVITKDGTNGELWVDGVLLATSTTVRTVISSGHLVVGNSLSSDKGQSIFFSGNIDELKIFNRALSSSEIQQLSLAGK